MLLFKDLMVFIRTPQPGSGSWRNISMSASIILNTLTCTNVLHINVGLLENFRFSPHLPATPPAWPGLAGGLAGPLLAESTGSPRATLPHNPSSFSLAVRFPFPHFPFPTDDWHAITAAKAKAESESEAPVPVGAWLSKCRRNICRTSPKAMLINGIFLKANS